MLNFMNKHKGLSVILGLSLILFIILLVIFVSLFLGNGESKYGNRLEGIEEVKLKDSFLKEFEDKLKEDESIVDANVRLQGKIVYVVFEVNSDIAIDTAKIMASTTLENFNDEELSFYDISYLIKWTKTTTDENGNEKKEISAIAGTKHPLKESITWSKS